MPKIKTSLATVAAIAVTIFAFVALLESISTKDAKAQADNPVWGIVGDVVPPTYSLFGAYMQDANTAWLAGGSSIGDPDNVGRVYKISWHDNKWVLDTTYLFRAPIRAIVAISADNVWAVGDDKLIVHRDAVGWQEVGDLTDLPERSNLTTIQMFSNGEEGWAAGTADTPAGSQGFTAHLVGGNVQKVTLNGGAPSEISSLHFAGGGGWAVGGGSIWRFITDKSGLPSWRPESEQLCQGGYACGTTLLAVRAINSNEAWAVGYRDYVSAFPSPATGVIFHRVNGQWQRVSVGLSGWGNRLNALSFSNDGVGLAVGGFVTDLGGTGFPLVVRYGADSEWHNQRIPSLPGVWLNSVSQFDSVHALAVGERGLVLSYGYGLGSTPPTPAPTLTPESPTVLPSEPIADPHDPPVTYFPLVGHALSGVFLDYWNAHGGLEQFGYPITEEFQEASPGSGKMYTVQYLERARFELHPENDPPYNVLLGLLGRTITHGRNNEAPFLPVQPQTSPGSVYFEATEHNLAPQFAQYWQGHGGLPVYGYPISEAFTETSPSDGKPYLVQYFERNRLEYHPELPDENRVSLGLLGVQLLKAMGWLR